MVWDIFELTSRNLKNDGLNIMLSESWKSAFKMASEDP